MSAEEEKSKGVSLGLLEGTAFHLGMLRVCQQLELWALAEDPEEVQWEAVKRALLLIVKDTNLDHFLRHLDPSEKLFEEGIDRRSEIDSRCFSTTYDQLLAIRKSRGLNIAPPEDAADGSSALGDGGTTNFSAFENYSRLCGMFEVLDWYEQAVSAGALPLQTHYEIARSLLIAENGNFKAIDVFLEALGCRDRVIPPNGSTGLRLEGGLQAKPGEPLHRMLVLVNRLRTDEKVFKELRHWFIGGHDDMSQRLAMPFVREFLKENTAAEPEGQVQEILFALGRRLRARREAVEEFEYHRLETIDGNIQHLLATLKQWGIEAKTYDEALKAYERRFGSEAKAPPKAKRDEISERIRSRIGDEVRLREDCEESVKANPQYEQFIRWEYEKEIGKLRGGRT